MEILLIGDIHGKVNLYKNIIKNNKFDYSIQIGDYGFETEHKFAKQLFDNKNFVLFGNHDYYPNLYENYSLGDFGNFQNSIFYVRGANSIDRRFRTEGFDWFPNEELEYSKSYELLDLYEKTKPKIVISYDCPQIVRQTCFNIFDKSTTSNLLQVMFEIHKPDLWIFGHHHRSINVVIDGVNFICLTELEHKTITI